MGTQEKIIAAAGRPKAGTVLLLCSGCDAERDTPVALCPCCEERTVSYEHVTGFDYAAAKFHSEVLRDGLLNAIVPPSLVSPFVTEPMPGLARAWGKLA